MVHFSGGNYTAQIDSSLLNATSYTLVISAVKQNFQSMNGSTTLIVSGTPTILDTAIEFGASWGENVTVWAVFSRVDPHEPILDASVTWSIQGTSLSGVMVHVGSGNYTAQVDTSSLSAKSYTLVITANKQSFEMQQKGVTFVVSAVPTVLGSAVALPPLLYSPVLYMGSLVRVENSVPLTPIVFQYHSLGPHSPISGANVTLTLGPLVFTLTEIYPGTYVAFVPTFGLPPTSLVGTITAVHSNYATQQSQVFLSVSERAVPIPFLNTRLPLSTLLTYLGLLALAVPAVGFVAYTFVKRARIPRIIKRIDELIVKISRGEKVDVHLISRDSVIQKIMREEISIVGVEPPVEEYVPKELADFIVPLLVEAGIKEGEAQALAKELKTAKPADRERLLESVGVPGEISEMIMQTIEKYEEMQKPPITLEKKREQPETEEAEEAEEGEPEERETKPETGAEEGGTGETEAKESEETEKGEGAEAEEEEGAEESAEKEEEDSDTVNEADLESEEKEEEQESEKDDGALKRRLSRRRKRRKTSS
jgi:hypothetical protein